MLLLIYLIYLFILKKEEGMRTATSHSLYNCAQSAHIKGSNLSNITTFDIVIYQLGQHEKC